MGNAGERAQSHRRSRVRKGTQKEGYGSEVKQGSSLLILGVGNHTQKCNASDEFPASQRSNIQDASINICTVSFGAEPIK